MVVLLSAEVEEVVKAPLEVELVASSPAVSASLTFPAKLPFFSAKLASHMETPLKESYWLCSLEITDFTSSIGL